MGFDQSFLEERRLRALHSLNTLDSGGEFYFDSLTKLASRLTGAPVCLISLVDSNRQVFKSSIGLDGALANLRETPLSHSFCKNVVAEREPFIVTDSHIDKRVEGNGAITDLSVRAYLGAPLIDPTGNILGAACAIDSEPRVWSKEDLEIMENIAFLAAAEFARSYATENAVTHAAKLEEEVVQLRDSLGILAHDLKNPLSTIVFAGAMAAEKVEKDSAVGGMLEMINSSSARMNEQIANVLERNSEEQIGKPRTLKAIDLVKFMTTAIAQQKLVFDRKNITPRIEDTDQEVIILADKVALGEVIENLLSNAVKFSAPDKTVTVRMVKDGFFITDEGPGFTAEDKANLFKRFTKLSASPTGGETSTGLGLAIAKTLMQEMGGNIECTSAVNEPAQFRVTLQLAKN